MNTNETSNDRLGRIKRWSGVLKRILLFYFVLAIGLAAVAGLHLWPGLRFVPDITFSTSNFYGGLRTYQLLNLLLSLCAIMAIYRLLTLHQKGIIFSAANISQIRRLGKLAVLGGVLSGWKPVFESGGIPITLPLSVIWSPTFLIGCLTLIIAWVMDEGRQLQEEQNLIV